MAPGRLAWDVLECGLTNPVFVLEGVDKVRDAEAGALLDVFDTRRRAGFRDRFLDIPFDLSPVLWTTTAVDVAAIPEVLRKHVEIVELPGYNEDEKLVIAEEHLLQRPFERSARPPEELLAAGAPSGSAADGAAPGGLCALTVAADRQVPPMEALPALLAEPPEPDAGGGGAEGWWTAAMRGRVRFEPEAVRRVIPGPHAGGRRFGPRPAARADLPEAARGGPATAEKPAVVTPAVVAEVLGGRAGDGVPPIVREAVAAERRRAGAGSPEDGGSAAWSDWLEHLPWARVREEIVDLWKAREALDIGHGVLGHAKAAVVEHSRGSAGAPRAAGIRPRASWARRASGKTSLARGVARALGRACAEVACGGLRDGADVRGRPRTCSRRCRCPGTRRRRRRSSRATRLLPAAIESSGLDPQDVTATPERLREIVRGWSRGPGVRDLAAALRAFCRRVARRHADRDPSGVPITPETVSELLGPSPTE